MAPKRADAQRNEQTLLDVAGAVFASSGVDAPVREIAARAGVGMGTIYRHFPTRADLVVAVYQHQIDTCVDAVPDLLATQPPAVALQRWMELIVDFLVTKHGLAAALQTDHARFETLHAMLTDRLVPACTRLLDAAGIGDVSGYAMLRAVGNLCAGVENDQKYDARRMVQLLVKGLTC